MKVPQIDMAEVENQLQVIFDESVEIRDRAQANLSKILELKQAVSLVALKTKLKQEVTQ